MKTKCLHTRVSLTKIALSLLTLACFAPDASGLSNNDAASSWLKLREATALASAAEPADATARALAAADFDEDGVPDLVTGFATFEGGSLTVRRGNVDAIYPNSVEANARRQRGEFTSAAFLPGGKNFAIRAAADFVSTGDFDADGHWDIVTASRGGGTLSWLRGDGHGNFASAKLIELGGAVTALVAGELNRRDGLTDVAVGIVAQEGAQVLVFESAEGALRGVPESIALPAAASSLAVGQLDQTDMRELVIASGHEVLLVHGRDRKLSLGEEQRGSVPAAEITRTDLHSPVLSLTVGDFVGGAETEIAALTANGEVRLLGRDRDEPTAVEIVASPATRLLALKVSSSSKSDLLVFGGSTALQVLTSAGPAKSTAPALAVATSVEADADTAAVLPMRLNADALEDLVVVTRSNPTPSVIGTAAAATYVVNVLGNTNDKTPGDGLCADDAGNCTFSAAIQESNAHAGADTVEFNLPGPGPHVVSPNFGQSFDEAVMIDGTTQPTGRVEIVANGYFPIIIYGGNSVIRGIVTYGNGSAIFLVSSGNIVEGNYIGFRADGTKPVGYGTFGSGIAFRGGPNSAYIGNNNLIGGTVAQARNVISNCEIALNVNAGVGNTFRGNYIGTNIDGTAALPNVRAIVADNGGDVTIGGATAGSGNVIAGSKGPSEAIRIGTVAAVIQGNLIGTTADGTQPIANGGIAIAVGGDKPVTIGGTTGAARNVIAASSLGVQIAQSGSASALLQGNYIGTNAEGSGALPNLSHGVILEGSNAVVGGAVIGAGNLISGNGDDGLRIGGFFAGGNNLVQGNLIGTDSSGAIALPNFSDGIELGNSRGNLIGGTVAGARNVLSGNRANGIRLSVGTSSPNRLEGNFIGVNRFGTGALGNQQHGVYFSNQANDIVGGSASGAGNIIANNHGDGIASNDAGYGIAGVILANSIFSNGGLGIDRGNDGVTPYQVTNFAQAPVITSVSTAGSQTTITGKLRTWTEGGNTPHTIQFFSNASSDPSGYGEGQTFIGQTTISAGSNAVVGFNATITPAVPPGRFVTAVAVGQVQASNPAGGWSSEFSFAVRTAGQSTPANTPLALHLLTPRQGGNTGGSTVTIIGEGIQQGATVVLRRAGQQDIVGQAVVVSADGSSITARFNLAARPIGTWDVVVRNPDGSTITLPDAFLVRIGSNAQPVTAVLGPFAIRYNRPARFTVKYGNLGTSDAYVVPLWITGIPKDAIVKLEFNLGRVGPAVAGGVDPGLISPIIKTGKEQIIPLLIPVIPAKGGGSLQLTIEVPTDEPLFILRSWTSAPLIETFGDGAPPQSGRVQLDGVDPIITSDAGVNCLNALFGAAAGCALSAVPGADCGRAFLNYTLNSATSSGDPLSISQLFAGATQLFYNCVAKESPGIGTILDVVGCLGSFYSASQTCRDSLEKEYPVQPVASRDPNDKVGARGTGPERYVTGAEPFQYSVLFENKATATAPAQEVLITDQLDVTKFDLETFQLGPISFGKNTVLTPPPGLSEWSTDVDLRPANNLIVRVIAALEKTSGVISWHFFSLDPATMQPTDDALAGFLPPNQNAPEGDGAVVFTVNPKPDLVTGTEITNFAKIVFDDNAAINTPVWLNTIDNTAPTSSVSPLAATQSSRRFQVSWSGTDTPAGIARYLIYVSENGGPYTLWLDNATFTSAVYDGRPNSSYAFYSIAQDNAGNYEAAPVTADASTATPASTPVQFTAASSRKLHGSASSFDIPLPTSGTPGIECRSGGSAGEYTVVFRFVNPVTRADAAIISGAASFDGGQVGFDPHEYVVNLKGVATGQSVQVTLPGVGDSAGNFSDSPTITMSVLIGDVNGDGAVNSGDAQIARNLSGQLTDVNNLRSDVNTDGRINSGDAIIIRNKSGNGTATLRSY